MKKIYIIIFFISIVFVFTVIMTSYFSKNYNPLISSDINLNLEMNNWNYDNINNIYYQLNLNYCSKPINTELENLDLYIPGEYMRGEKNEYSNTYTCSVSKDSKIMEFSSNIAPIIIFINSSENENLNKVENIMDKKINKYLKEGYICVVPKFRGINSNVDEYEKKIIDAVVDLKAVIRFLNLNRNLLPGAEGKIFVLGKEDDGSLAVILGASGDSEFFVSELYKIGGIIEDYDGNKVSDSIDGVICNSPVLYDTENVFEWIKNNYSQNDHFLNYVKYINFLKLKSEDGTLLTLKINDNFDIVGTYNQYIIKEMEMILNLYISSLKKSFKNENDESSYVSENEYVNKLDKKCFEYDKEKKYINIKSIKDFYEKCNLNNTNKIIKNECNPIYFLSDKFEGYNSTTVAEFWYITSVLERENINFILENNLKLILQNNENIRKVDYSSFWKDEFAESEFENFYDVKNWIYECIEMD